MNEFQKAQSAKILSVYGLNSDELEKAKAFQLGQLDKSGRNVKTTDGWKPITTHGHLVRHPHPEAGKKPKAEKQIEIPVTVVSNPISDEHKQKTLLDIRNEKNRKLKLIEEKLDDHNRGINILEDEELNQLRQNKVILQATIDNLDRKIKNQSDDDIVESISPSEIKLTEDPDEEPEIIQAA